MLQQSFDYTCEEKFMGVILCVICWVNCEILRVHFCIFLKKNTCISNRVIFWSECFQTRWCGQADLTLECIWIFVMQNTRIDVENRVYGEVFLSLQLFRYDRITKI